MGKLKKFKRVAMTLHRIDEDCTIWRKAGRHQTLFADAVLCDDGVQEYFHVPTNCKQLFLTVQSGKKRPAHDYVRVQLGWLHGCAPTARFPDDISGMILLEHPEGGKQNVRTDSFHAFRDMIRQVVEPGEDAWIGISYMDWSA